MTGEVPLHEEDGVEVFEDESLVPSRPIVSCRGLEAEGFLGDVTLAFSSQA